VGGEAMVVTKAVCGGAEEEEGNEK